MTSTIAALITATPFQRLPLLVFYGTDSDHKCIVTKQLDCACVLLRRFLDTITSLSPMISDRNSAEKTPDANTGNESEADKKAEAKSPKPRRETDGSVRIISNYGADIDEEG